MLEVESYALEFLGRIRWEETTKKIDKTHTKNDIRYQYNHEFIQQKRVSGFMDIWIL